MIRNLKCAIAVAALGTAGALADPVPYGVFLFADSQAGNGSSLKVLTDGTGGPGSTDGLFLPGVTTFSQAPLLTASAFNDGIGSGNAAANVFGTVSLGTITGFAQADSQEFEPPGRGGGEGSDASLSAFFQDQITVVSSALPVDTPVDLLFTLVLDSKATGNCAVGGNIAAVDTSFGATGPGTLTSLGLQNSTCQPAATSQSVTGIAQTFVGATLSIEGSFVASSIAGGLTDGTKLVNVADAAHTSKFFVDSLTPGASYTSASGVSYLEPAASSVPEPHTFGMIVLASVGLLILRRSNRRRRTMAQQPADRVVLGRALLGA